MDCDFVTFVTLHGSRRRTANDVELCSLRIAARLEPHRDRSGLSARLH